MRQENQKKEKRKMWDIISAIPAIATILGWFTGRYDRKHGKPIVVSIKEMKEPSFSYFPEDFAPLEITFRNDNPFDIVLTEIAITNVRVGRMAIGVRKPSLVTHMRSIMWNPQQLLNKDVYLTLPTAFGETGIPITTGTPELDEIFFVDHDTIRASNNTLDFCLTFRLTSHKNLYRKIHVRGVLFEPWRKPKTEYSSHQIIS